MTTTKPEPQRTGTHRAAPRRSRRGFGSVVGATLALGLIAVAIGYLAPWKGTKTEASGGCTANVSIAAAPDIADTVDKVLAAAGCDQADVAASAAKETLGRMGDGQKRPDLWIPDSSLWADQAGQDARTLKPSLASTPVVLVAGRGEPAGTWQSALADQRFVLGNPDTSTASVGALLAGAGKSESQLFAMALRAPDPAPGGADPNTAGQTEQLKRITETGGSTVVSEQVWLSQAPALSASVPDPGTISLDYPLVLTADAARRKPIGGTVNAITAALTDEAAARALAEQGFRTSDGAPPGEGVGDVTDLPINGATAAALLDRWGRLMRPVRAIAVADVSGSMNFNAGNATRADLVVASARRLIPLFPNRTSLGFWIFSQADDGRLGADYRETLPVRRMDATADGSTQRVLLAAQLGQLQTLTGGGTSLYDTTLAAYRAALRDYDPGAHNNVFLFTDGTNEDPDSVSRSELLRQLRELNDPERPVRIISIGLSQDADADVLNEISAATGGESFIARDPSDIEAVLRQVMMAST